MCPLIPSTPKSVKYQNSSKFQISFSKNTEKQMVPCKSTAEEVSFEWSHHRISFTDSKVRTTFHVSITDFGNEKVNGGSTVISLIVKYRTGHLQQSAREPSSEASVQSGTRSQTKLDEMHSPFLQLNWSRLHCPGLTVMEMQ